MFAKRSNGVLFALMIAMAVAIAIIVIASFLDLLGVVAFIWIAETAVIVVGAWIARRNAAKAASGGGEG